METMSDKERIIAASMIERAKRFRREMRKRNPRAVQSFDVLAQVVSIVLLMAVSVGIFLPSYQNAANTTIAGTAYEEMEEVRNALLIRQNESSRDLPDVDEPLTQAAADRLGLSRFLTNVPRDPVSGQPFRLRVIHGAAFVFALGPYSADALRFLGIDAEPDCGYVNGSLHLAARNCTPRSILLDVDHGVIMRIAMPLPATATPLPWYRDRLFLALFVGVCLLEVLVAVAIVRFPRTLARIGWIDPAILVVALVVSIVVGSPAPFVGAIVGTFLAVGVKSRVGVA